MFDTLTEYEQTWNTLSPLFKRPIPDDEKYIHRLMQELQVIHDQNFAPHFLRVREILNLAADIPHITRGSAGSSLVCYLMGITDVDPVHHDIPLARFLNPLRDDLPDIDVDFPQMYHAEVLNRIYAHWPGRAARLSNYVCYRERSAQKEALKRVCGITGKAARDKNPIELVPDDQKPQWRTLTQKLMGKKRCISKHPGGVVVFDTPPARSLIRSDHQILLDKHECEDLAHLKVDILSNRGLSVLWSCAHKSPFDYTHECDQTFDMLARGDTVGIVQGESPVMRRMLRTLQPRTISDLALAVALIRPAALTGRQKGVFFREWIGHNHAPGDLKHSGGVIFDEDAIHMICRATHMSTYEADWYRRAFIKKNEQVMFDLMEKISHHEHRDEIMHNLQHMHGFGLCKAHALNLAQLIYAQAYEKLHNPRAFWLAVMQHTNSMYRPWVHVEAAKQVGWRIQGHARPWLVKGDTMYNDDWQVPLFESHVNQAQSWGFWTHDDFMPGCYYQQMGDQATFCGVVAAHRMYHQGDGAYVTFVTLGVGRGQLLDVVIPHAVHMKSVGVIEGSGRVIQKPNHFHVHVNSHTMFTWRSYAQHVTS
jgi:DNA polymerase III alpha subunit